MAGDKYHWSASHWGEHWRQRIDAVLARGQAALVTAAVGKSRNQRQEADTHGRHGRSLALLVADVLPAMRASAVRQRIVTVEEPTHWIALHHS